MEEFSTVTKEFLEKTLKCPVVDFVLTQGSQKGDNYIGVMISAEVQTLTNEGFKKKDNIIIKCYPLHPARQELNNSANFFYNELKVYELWMPALVSLKNRYMPITDPLPFAQFIGGEAINYKAIGENTFFGKLLYTF